MASHRNLGIKKLPYIISNNANENEFLKGTKKADYFYNYYENKNTGQTNRFQIAGASIYYNKENSPWGFEIRIENLFDVRYKNKNSFSQFLVLDKNIYIQPRTMLFVLSYKL